MPLWDPEQAKRRKLVIDSQRNQRELDLADESAVRLVRAERLSWACAVIMNASAMFGATPHRPPALQLSFGAAAAMAAVAVSDSVGRRVPRLLRLGIWAYAITAALLLVRQLIVR